MQRLSRDRQHGKARSREVDPVAYAKSMARCSTDRLYVAVLDEPLGRLAEFFVCS